MGEEHKIAKRVVELSMQLANSRADVENLRMRIKAVDKEHEQLKKDRADMVDRFDAALRRAKAEVWREAARLSRMRAHDHALAISRADDVLHRGVEFAKQIEAERIAEAFDARAAQIEEGE